MSHLYILQCEQFFKIGQTVKDIKQRVKGLKTGNPLPIKIILDVEYYCRYTASSEESRFHDKYKRKRSTGEWFALSQKDILYIRSQSMGHQDLKTCKIVNLPDFEDVNTKDNYWKRKYLRILEDLKSSKRDRHSESLSYGSSLSWMRRLLEIEESKTRKIREINKKLKTKLKEKQNLAEDHSLSQIMERLNDLKGLHSSSS